ncbi:MAG: filamentous hemagglutinin N-terminal domain-containing protein, partial [Symploca sp. SIO3E6]|nr:filamentous hemagglutinin N-terminal domain-containing protein [Caldora sp. SIO3E6]
MFSKLSLKFFFLTLLSVLIPIKANAQITPANDGTGTTVQRNGETFNIDGGSRSGDGRNLFHSLQDFGLDANQIANFLSSPETQNILGRVTGGNASMIDGLIRVSGSDANLFLMNPAGIIFGSNARLDVPSSFTATTANSIGFGDSWFNAFGENNYAALVGNPGAFAFTLSNPGSIINAGELGVRQGESLTLLGGTVINTGTLLAPGGQITVAAVPGENLVRISQENSLLSLELDTITPGSLNSPDSAINPVPFTPLDIPGLLTGGNVSSASGMLVEADGTVRLISSNTSIPTASGTAIVSGTVDASGSSTSEINILGDRTGILNATIQANGDTGGGTIRIGGDYQGGGSVFNASRTFVDGNSTITADALRAGNGGRVIVWADDVTGFYGNITARGGQESGNGGFVEVSGLDFLDFQGVVDTSAPNGAMGTLLLDPTNIEIVATGGTATALTDVDNFLDPDTDVGDTTTIDAALLDAALADVILQATNDITFSADVNIAEPQVGLTAEAGNNIAVNSNITTNGGNVTFTANADGVGAGAVSVNNATITTQGGDFTASGQGNATFLSGISINNSNINPGNGNIQLIGIGQDGQNLGDDNNGIVIFGGSLLETTDNGRISLDGTGGNGEDSNHGISILDSTLRTENGAIDLEGTGQGNSFQNLGILLLGNTLVETTGNGSITFNGFGGDGTSSNTGVWIFNNARVQTVTGNIDITGTGGNGTAISNYGVFLYSNAQVTSVDGNITLEGTGGGGTNNQRGISIGGEDGTGALNGSTVATTGIGNITMNGTGGTGTFNNIGIAISTASEVRTIDGQININGTGGNSGNDFNRGIIFDRRIAPPGAPDAGNIGDGGSISSINGDINVVGTGSGAGGSNHGSASC